MLPMQQQSALQQWTPCLPIRGGKLKASKPFSTSNPQLPFICATSSGGSHSGAAVANQSLNSLNSSYIWREATPNNFNLYSASIPSLNSYRYSASQPPRNPLQQHHHAAGSGPSSLPNFQREPRAHSEDRAHTAAAGNSLGIPGKTPSPAPSSSASPFQQQQQVCKYKTASNYDNLYITSCNTPILSRKSSAQQLMTQRHSNASSARTHYQNYPFPAGLTATATASGTSIMGSPYLYTAGQASYIPQLLASSSAASDASRAAAAAGAAYKPPTTPQQAFLYDRRVNRSFDSPQEFARGSKVGPLRRSTPQLVVTDNDLGPEDMMNHYYAPHYHQPSGQGNDHLPDSARNSINSTSWCCGNMFKHWRKYHNYE